MSNLTQLLVLTNWLNINCSKLYVTLSCLNTMREHIFWIKQIYPWYTPKQEIILNRTNFIQFTQIIVFEIQNDLLGLNKICLNQKIVISFHIAIGKICRTIAELNVRIGYLPILQKKFLSVDDSLGLTVFIDELTEYKIFYVISNFSSLGWLRHMFSNLPSSFRQL